MFPNFVVISICCNKYNIAEVYKEKKAIHLLNWSNPFQLFGV